jgi:hypothetical protein
MARGALAGVACISNGRLNGGLKMTGRSSHAPL